MTDTCLVCNNEEAATCRKTSRPNNFDGSEYDCDSCGRYRMVGSLEASSGVWGNLSRIQRASLSHILRTRSDAGDVAILRSNDFERFSKIPDLPSPPQQATNVIRIIGDHERKTGEHFKELPVGFLAQIGALTRTRAVELTKELLVGGLIKVKDAADTMKTNNFARCALTFTGWERYEAERAGRLAGDYGFIAMKFGDAVLDKFLGEAIKPAVENLSFRLLDMRDAARAGIIDDIMRVTIRDAAFVLVDLTHDNYGAYWEAGYAEGLGKPVIYICEKSKFETKGTHFDTNHLTTVPWEAANASDFSTRLIATLRNTLKLF